MRKNEKKKHETVDHNSLDGYQVKTTERLNEKS